MAKVKKGLLTAVLFLLTIVTCLSFVACGNGETDAVNEKSAVGYEEATPYGLYTDLQFSLNGENGLVYASVKNKFTLFPSTVTVNVELYRSGTYQENVANMTLAASNYIYDLDQGETLTATASTEGRQSYWKAKASYRVDNGSWQTNFSDTVFLDKNGIRTTEPAPEPDDKEYFISDFLQIDAYRTWLEMHLPPLHKPGIWYMQVVERLENENQMNTIRNIFGEVKLNPFVAETREEQDKFFFSENVPELLIDLVSDNGERAIIYVDKLYQDDLGANLFVRYIIEKDDVDIYKYFTGSISDEVKNSLIEFANEIFYEHHGKIDG